jgi:tryptophan synthase alpha chain
MSALSDAFAAARGAGRALLVGYLPAGYPTVEGSIAAMTAMVAAGVDVVEVGLPYSDPLMDGPVIEDAARVALEHGTRTADVIRVVEAVAATGAPTVVMSYWNPIDHYGVERFARDLAAAGGSGVITPDLIPDEGAEWLTAAGAFGLDPIFLVAPSSTEARLRATTTVTRGFVYAASTMGVTGTRAEVSSMAPALVARVRAVTDLPIGVGLGVSTAAQAEEVAGYADAVIVGSALVRAQGSDGPAAVAALAADLAGGIRGTVRIPV